MAVVTWYATLLPLAGVALGSGGTLIGQYLTTRVDVRRQQREQLVAERGERKEAILGFLSAAQSVELLLDGHDFAGRRPEDDEVMDRLHGLWLAKKACELVCSAEVAQAAHDYTLALHRLVRAEAPVKTSKGELRHAFMETARRELGVADPHLRRGPLPPVSGVPTS
ncbi:hypothetical protein GCM10023196_055300 [Actinoallomurus vinaceus]|uniref:Secreted protein n=1 Tax=Actinoallomurus vinaceus TaxID=1080074 RepID=A0ABP8UEZ7_9ACTN